MGDRDRQKNGNAGLVAKVLRPVGAALQPLLRGVTELLLCSKLRQ